MLSIRRSSSVMAFAERGSSAVTRYFFASQLRIVSVCFACQGPILRSSRSAYGQKGSLAPVLISVVGLLHQRQQVVKESSFFGFDIIDRAEVWSHGFGRRHAAVCYPKQQGHHDYGQWDDT